MSGVAPLADPPLTWSRSENIKWKSPIPGYGTSTPIIWGDHIFILSAVPTGKQKPEAGPADSGADTEPKKSGKKGGLSVNSGKEVHQFVILCFDRKDGAILWQRIAREEVPHEGHHPDHGYASASPVTDGQSVFAYFGSRGLHCYDFAGKLKWSKDFGPMHMRNAFGEGSSPALHGDTIVIYRDDETDSDFIAALDKKTGKELWRTPRQEASGWSTPLILERDGKAQVIVTATDKVRSYELATGKEIWSCAGQTANPIPSPVASDDTVYVTSGYRGSALYAIALGRTGDLTGTDAIRWKHDKNTPYAPSPLLVDDLLYVVRSNSGVLSCFDARTGAAHFEGERLEGINGIYASPVAAKDRVYVLGRDGTCLVLKKGPKLEILARNQLNEKTDASMATVGNALFIRSHQNLYCIEKK